jgi:hypothetical protein
MLPKSAVMGVLERSKDRKDSTVRTTIVQSALVSSASAGNLACPLDWVHIARCAEGRLCVVEQGAYLSAFVADGSSILTLPRLDLLYNHPKGIDQCRKMPAEFSSSFRVRFSCSCSWPPDLSRLVFGSKPISRRLRSRKPRPTT